MVIEKVVKIGARASPLAIKQAEEIAAELKKSYPSLRYEVITTETYGDKDKITPLSEVEGSDFFTREIEEQLLKGEIDFAVHSAKDLPEKLPEGLAIAAVTKSLDPYDALVSQDNLSIYNLKPNARIGASSLRRKTQLQQYRADFKIVDIRGTIQERLEKLTKENLDAIIVAACALLRLGLADKISQRVPFAILAAHPLQGALAIEVKKDNQELKEWLGVLSLP